MYLSELVKNEAIISDEEAKGGYEPENGEGFISRLLLTGEENAIPMRELMGITGMDSREIRLCIQRERLAGIPLLSNNTTGYYMAADEAEIRRFARSMRRRAAEIVKVARAIEEAAELD